MQGHDRVSAWTLLQRTSKQRRRRGDGGAAAGGESRGGRACSPASAAGLIDRPGAWGAAPPSRAQQSKLDCRKAAPGELPCQSPAAQMPGWRTGAPPGPPGPGLQSGTPSLGPCTLPSSPSRAAIGEAIWAPQLHKDTAMAHGGAANQAHAAGTSYRRRWPGSLSCAPQLGLLSPPTPFPALPSLQSYQHAAHRAHQPAGLNHFSLSRFLEPPPAPPPGPGDS